MLTSEVKSHNGMPTLFLNGKPENGIMQWNRWPESVDVENFHRSGVDILSFMGNIWLGKEHDDNMDKSRDNNFTDKRLPCMIFDHATIDRMMTMLTQANPDLLVMPRIRLIPPDWWKAKYSDELMRHYLPDADEYEDGNWAAITSSLWCQTALKALAETIEYFEGRWCEHVIGYHTGFADCVEHSYYWGGISDYSRPQTQAFRYWLKTKYSDSQVLKKAWGISDVDFSTALIPSPDIRLGRSKNDLVLYDPQKEQWAIDYQQFSSEVMANEY